MFQTALGVGSICDLPERTVNQMDPAIDASNAPSVYGSPQAGNVSPVLQPQSS